MDETFHKLKEQLDLQEWPEVYLFKFIVPNENKKVARVSALFNEGADMRFKNSRNGKYMSISIKEVMLSSDAVIEKYMNASKIEGLIML
jgi:hypothetical protein